MLSYVRSLSEIVRIVVGDAVSSRRRIGHDEGHAQGIGIGKGCRTCLLTKVFIGTRQATQPI